MGPEKAALLNVVNTSDSTPKEIKVESTKISRSFTYSTTDRTAYTLFLHYSVKYDIASDIQIFGRDLKGVNAKAAIDWIDKVNDLKPEDRMNCKWTYVLLGENTFYGMSQKGAETKEILDYAILTKAQAKGTLGDYLGIKEY